MLKPFRHFMGWEKEEEQSLLDPRPKSKAGTSSLSVQIEDQASDLRQVNATVSSSEAQYLFITFEVGKPTCTVCTDTIGNALTLAGLRSSIITHRVITDNICIINVNDPSDTDGSDLQSLYEKVTEEIEDIGFYIIGGNKGFTVVDTDNYLEILQQQRLTTNTTAELVKIALSATLGITLKALQYSGEYQPMTSPVVDWSVTAASLAVISYTGGHFFRSSANVLKAFVRAIWNKKENRPTLGMDVLASLYLTTTCSASLAAIITNQIGNPISKTLWLAVAALNISAIKASQYAKQRTIEQSAQQQWQQIVDLIKAQPQQSRLITESKDKINTTTPIHYKAITPQQKLLIQPGDIIPVDGFLLGSNTVLVNSKRVNGEAKKLIRPGDPIFAGSRYLSDQPCTIEASCCGGSSIINQMLRSLCLPKPPLKKHPLSNLTDNVSEYYIFGILLVVIIDTLVLSLLGFPSNSILHYQINIIGGACPCTFGLAFPTPIAMALNSLRFEGVTIFDPNVVLAIQDAKHFFIDKTGTLTHTDIVDMRVFEHKAVISTGGEAKPINKLQCLRFAILLESYFLKTHKHPIAEAIKRYAFDALTPAQRLEFNLELESKQLTDFSAERTGLSACLAGIPVLIGNLAWMTQHDVIVPETVDSNCVFLAINQLLSTAFMLGEVLKPCAKPTIDSLKSQDVRITVLTGDDDPIRIKHCQNSLEVKCKSNLLPQDKEDIIASAMLMQNQGQSKTAHPPIVMIGDGGNDSLALMKADIGIALSSTSSTMLSNIADVVISELDKILMLSELSTQLPHIINSNINIAIYCNLLIMMCNAIVLPALTIEIDPIIPIFIMTTLSFVIVLNSTRAKRSSGSKAYCCARLTSTPKNTVDKDVMSTSTIKPRSCD